MKTVTTCDCCLFFFLRGWENNYCIFDCFLLKVTTWEGERPREKLERNFITPFLKKKGPRHKEKKGTKMFEEMELSLVTEEETGSPAPRLSLVTGEETGPSAPRLSLVTGEETDSEGGTLFLATTPSSARGFGVPEREGKGILPIGEF